MKRSLSSGSRMHLFLGLLFAPLMIGLLVPSLVTATPFVHEGVDITISILPTALGIDARDDPHVAYVVFTNVMYAIRRGGVWVYETLPVGGLEIAMVLDGQDVPHLAIRTDIGSGLLYAARPGGTWFAEPVDTVGTFPSIAVDPGGVPHIAYVDQDNKDLRYATKNGPVWVVDKVPVGGVDVETSVSIALDAEGRPHIAFEDRTNTDLRHAVKIGGTWTVELVDAAPSADASPSLVVDARGVLHVAYRGSGGINYAQRINDVWSNELAAAVGIGTPADPWLALDGQGNPHISFYDFVNYDNLGYAVKQGGQWQVEFAQVNGNVGWENCLALDSQGNPHISYLDVTVPGGAQLMYATAAVILDNPHGGEIWPVGAVRSVNWFGEGPVDILLSVDGGRSFDLLAYGLFPNENVAGGKGRYDFVVPHSPSRFCQIKVERSDPFSYATSDSFLTIEASVALLNMSASLEPAGGVLLSWETDPGPADLAGYKVERSPIGGDSWRVLASMVRETSYRDAAGGAGMRYRLTAINGLGEELLLGETALAPRAALAAWPLPYRGGDLTISFATHGALRGGAADADVRIFDASGRLIRTVVSGSYEQGDHPTTWDGRDSAGRPVGSGVYLLQAVSAGERTEIKLVVIR